MRRKGDHTPWGKPRVTNHPGYRVADPTGQTFLMVARWPQWEFEVAEREACAAGGIVVRADWQAMEPAAATDEKLEIGPQPTWEDRHAERVDGQRQPGT